MSLVQQRLIESAYDRTELVTAGPGRRVAGFFLDSLIYVFTLGIGWIIWFALIARHGQTPGKRLLHMYIMREDATRAGGGYTVLREILIKYLFFVISLFTLGGLWSLGAFWCLWDRDRQCLWDKLGSTYIAYAPSGAQPQTLPERVQLGLPLPGVAPA